jgi:ankyrin repeat protein
MKDTNIHFNAVNNNIAELKNNIKDGVDIDVLGEYASTPLHYACREGNLEIVNFLIEQGANVNSKNHYSTIYPIFDAINSRNNQKNYFLIIQSLIESGVDINKTDSFGNTLLYHAIEEENMKLIELLIQLGCDINQVSRHDKDSALHYAYFQKNRKIISMLINSGANQEHLNIYNKTPRHYL